MKINTSFTMSYFYALSALAVCLLSQSPIHAAPASVSDSNARASVYVTVPVKGPSSQIVTGKKKTIVSRSKTAPIPSASSTILLRKGTVISTSQPCKRCGRGIVHHYTVIKPITLAGLDASSFASNSDSIKPGVIKFKQTGDILFPDYLTSRICICRYIGLPSGTFNDLLDAVKSAAGRTVNPFNVMSEGVTDGNDHTKYGSK